MADGPPKGSGDDAERSSGRTRRFRCVECSAELRYDAALGRLKCSHCGYSEEVAPGAGRIIARSLEDGLAEAPRGLGAEEARASSCDECGARVAFADGAVAARCTFCGSTRLATASDQRGALRPESLLPFSVDKRRANQMFGAWLDRLWLRPSDLRALARVQEVNGVYIPFWSFDAHVDSRWTAEAGYHSHEREPYHIQGGPTLPPSPPVRTTRWERTWGYRADQYRDQLVCASRGLPPELASRLRTFEIARLRPYGPGYLAGWRVEEYAIELPYAFEAAKLVMEAAQRRRCARDVPGDVQRNLSVSSTFSSVRFKHVLLPVWLAAYRYRGRVYRFLVNGQTGEVVGKAPWSVGKLGALAVSVLATVLLLYFFFGNAWSHLRGAA
jgi:DNA-directed RNA polymerase subunit RPC12/RpoP